MTYTPVFLHRDIAFASAILPQTIERMMAFCKKYDTDTKPEEIKEQAWRMFGCGDKRLGLWAMVKDMKTVVGHLMAQPEPWGLENGPWQYVLIRQAEIDKYENTLTQTPVVMASIEQWTRSLGLSRIVFLTHRKGALMSRRWGFRHYKVIMEKHI